MVVKALLAGAAIACFATVAEAQIDSTLSLYAKPGRMVSLPDGRQMNLRCAGSGSPTVVLEAGSDNNGSLTWNRIYPKLTTFARVCSYDRAGIMYSDAGPLPRTKDRIASDLHALLQAAREKGPFVLVGHSLGGVYVRAYAEKYPAQVGGLVVLDGSAEGQWRAFGPKGGELLQMQKAALARCISLAERHEIKPSSECLSPKSPVFPNDLSASLVEIKQKPTGPRTMLSELEEFGALPPLGRDGKPVLADKPLRVLYVAHPELGEQLDKTWAGMAGQVATLSTKGQLQFVPNSGHYIQRDQPDVAVQAIHEVWSQASN